ncbi:hypothetical protein C5167_035119 [Papaver somniferum]|uniref:Uncharacterized protein n=1 Tax=Papaver somniferum TaxID=3469 RepID=A0A4Y7KJ17_PAPSO|nr:hypothetical protein C5167_035119 [Papaver somniferum]
MQRQLLFFLLGNSLPIMPEVLSSNIRTAELLLTERVFMENGNSHSTDSSVLIVNWNHSGIVSVKTLVILKNEGRNILIYGEEGSLEGGINHDVTAAAPFVKINTISLAHAYDNGTYACVRFDDEGRVRGLEEGMPLRSYERDELQIQTVREAYNDNQQQNLRKQSWQYERTRKYWFHLIIHQLSELNLVLDFSEGFWIQDQNRLCSLLLFVLRRDHHYTHWDKQARENKKRLWAELQRVERSSVILDYLPSAMSKEGRHEKAKHTMGQKTFLDANLNCNGIAIGLVKGNLLGNLAPKNGRSAFQLSVVNEFKFRRWDHHYTHWDKQARERIRNALGRTSGIRRLNGKDITIHLKIQMKWLG